MKAAEHKNWSNVGNGRYTLALAVFPSVNIKINRMERPTGWQSGRRQLTALHKVVKQSEVEEVMMEINLTLRWPPKQCKECGKPTQYIKLICNTKTFPQRTRELWVIHYLKM